MKTEKNRLSVLASAVIVLLTVWGLCLMFRSREEGILTARGLRNLKYFTVDSNLLAGLAHLAALVLSLTGASARRPRAAKAAESFLYISTVAVLLTFSVVVLFFGPTVGYRFLFRGTNLYYHLIIPVAACLFYCVFHRGRFIPMRETAAALIPALVYAVFYTVPILIRGAHFPVTDWYGFAKGGLSGSVIMASGIFLADWMIALLLRLAAGGTKKQSDRREPL